MWNLLLELKRVSYAYHTKNGETYALSDLSFQVQSGEFIAIVGPSGCGKSTLLSLISGLSLGRERGYFTEWKRGGDISEKISDICCRKTIFLSGGAFTEMEGNSRA